MTGKSRSERQSDADRKVHPSRRRFLAYAGGVPLFASGTFPRARASTPDVSSDRSRVNALLLSATTLHGKKSLEHGYKELAELYGDRRNILLINFASLPEDRDAYEARMQRDFSSVGSGFNITSLHRVEKGNAVAAVREAEAFFVSGGNTFLLLRELYDRNVVDVLRERVFAGVPYAGSSAGSNIAGVEIGTTNDFPLVDVSTRRSLGLFSGCFNPHHPSPESEKDLFDGRQWKIKNYCRYHKDTVVIGVTNPGMLRLKGEQVMLLGDGAAAFVQEGNRETRIYDSADRDLSAILLQ